jgi:hypothetical protein
MNNRGVIPGLDPGTPIPSSAVPRIEVAGSSPAMTAVVSDADTTLIAPYFTTLASENTISAAQSFGGFSASRPWP